jgi:hypothetical protein
MSLAESLERAAEALSDDADGIRPANGDPIQLLALLDVEAAGRVLGWLLANAPKDAEELASEWLDEQSGAAVLSRVQASEEVGSLPKEGRKVLRRVLHRARSRGIAIDAAAGRPEPKVARLPKVDDDIGAAYVSPHDPRGSRLVYLVEASPAGGARVFEALLDEERGIIDFQVYQAGRRQVREFIRDVTRRASYRAVSAEPEAVRELIARRAEGQPKDRALPKAFGEWRGKLFKPTDGQQTPGEQARSALEESVDVGSIESLAERVAERKIGPWPPAGLDETIADFHKIAMGLREEGGDDAEERLESVVRERLMTLYASEGAAAVAERFEEYAYLLWREDEVGQAQAALATATAFRAREITASPVAGALIGLLQKAILGELRRSLEGEASDDDAGATNEVGRVGEDEDHAAADGVAETAETAETES